MFMHGLDRPGYRYDNCEEIYICLLCAHKSRKNRKAV